MARKNKAVPAAVPEIPSVEERIAEIINAEQRANDARIRRIAERDVEIMRDAAAAAKVRVDDPSDIQRIMDVLPDGGRWQAGRGYYWAKGPILLRGKTGLYLNFGGSTVDFAGTAEFPFLPSEREQQQIFNLNVTGIYVPPEPAESEEDEGAEDA